MITFILLTLVFAVLAIIGIFTVLTGGVAFFVVFGDIIIFTMLITWIVKRLIEKHKKD